MTTPEDTTKEKIRLNQNNLYKEDVFTDLTVGSIRQLSPVKPNGESDKTRKILFLGQTQIISQHGPLPIQFPIEAKNLQQAIENFPESLEQFMSKLVEEAKEMQRREQSRIIVPGGPAGPGTPGSPIILK
jgi:hypothetical protein